MARLSVISDLFMQKISGLGIKNEVNLNEVALDKIDKIFIEMQLLMVEV